jgi:nickel/cobalt transporter (NicO) family protein
MTDPLLPTLAVAAVTVGALHSLAPDHWLPIAAVSRARNWSQRRTARVTLLCGFGHVTVSVILGLVALLTGTAVVETLGATSASVAWLLMIGFGVAYLVWGLRRTILRRMPSHAHTGDVGDPSKKSVWALFAIYCADPCIAVIPIIFAAAPLSIAATIGIVLVYEAATIGTMVGLTALARAGSSVIGGRWVDRYGDSAAGGMIIATGIVVALIGI